MRTNLHHKSFIVVFVKLMAFDLGYDVTSQPPFILFAREVQMSKISTIRVKIKAEANGGLGRSAPSRTANCHFFGNFLI